jgi:hypothetical protein
MNTIPPHTPVPSEQERRRLVDLCLTDNYYDEDEMEYEE